MLAIFRRQSDWILIVRIDFKFRSLYALRFLKSVLARNILNHFWITMQFLVSRKNISFFFAKTLLKCLYITIEALDSLMKVANFLAFDPNQTL